MIRANALLCMICCRDINDNYILITTLNFNLTLKLLSQNPFEHFYEKQNIFGKQNLLLSIIYVIFMCDVLSKLVFSISSFCQSLWQNTFNKVLQIHKVPTNKCVKYKLQ